MGHIRLSDDEVRETAAARRRACPYCRARPGTPCVTRKGALYMWRGREIHHVERFHETKET